MNLLVPHGRTTDKYLVRAAQVAGHKVHFMCNLQEMDRLDDTRLEVAADSFVAVPTRFDLKLSNEDYLDWYHGFMFSYVQDHMIHAILPSCSMDIIMREVAMINEVFDLPGLTLDQADIFRDKATYLPMLAEAGVPTPEIYEIVEPAGEACKNPDYPFPVIAKPGLGSGGYGSFIAEDAERLDWFFGPSDNPSGFSERARFYQDRDFSGQPKSYLHFGMGGRYLVQQYLEGPCISLAGTAQGGVLSLDLAYDIGLTPPPHCSEITFSWPSVHDIEGAAERCRAALQGALPFPDGAWMADAILHRGELHVVDISPRMSSSGTKMLYHTVGNNPAYAANVLSCLLHGDRDYKINPRHETYYSFIPFPKGRLTNLHFPSADSLYEAELPESGSRVFEMRNDIQVADRGWVVAQGDDARAQVDAYIAGISYDVE